jgi:hypothetical protein
VWETSAATNPRYSHTPLRRASEAIPDHGDAEQDITNHEQDRRQPIDDHHRQVLANRVEHRRSLFGQDRGEETKVPRHCNEVRQEPV